MSSVLGVLAFELADAELHAISSRAAAFSRVAIERFAGGSEFKFDVLHTGGETGVVHGQGVTSMNGGGTTTMKPGNRREELQA
jgi:hypothetical protein